MINLEEFITESNRIEGILREPLPVEIKAHKDLLALGEISIGDLGCFVGKIQPGAILRCEPGRDVRVGNYYPPPGGPEIPQRLRTLLEEANDGVSPYHIHLAYENLHPFTDGNGRSGRALWLWQHQGFIMLGFLHQFYYDTLSAGSGRKV